MRGFLEMAQNGSKWPQMAQNMSSLLGRSVFWTLVPFRAIAAKRFRKQTPSKVAILGVTEIFRTMLDLFGVMNLLIFIFKKWLKRIILYIFVFLGVPEGLLCCASVTSKGRYPYSNAPQCTVHCTPDLHGRRSLEVVYWKHPSLWWHMNHTWSFSHVAKLCASYLHYFDT